MLLHLWTPLFICCLTKASRPYNTPAAISHEKVISHKWPTEYPQLRTGTLSIYNSNVLPVFIHYITHSIMDGNQTLFEEIFKSLSFRGRQLSQDLPLSYQFENPKFRDKWDLYYRFEGKNFTFENTEIYASFTEDSKGILLITLLNFRRTCRFKMATGVEVPFSLVEV